MSVTAKTRHPFFEVAGQVQLFVGLSLTTVLSHALITDTPIAMPSPETLRHMMFAVAAVFAVAAIGGGYFVNTRILNGPTEDEWLASMQDQVDDDSLVISRGKCSRFWATSGDGQEVASGKSNADGSRFCIQISGHPYDVMREWGISRRGQDVLSLEVYAGQASPADSGTALVSFQCEPDVRDGYYANLKGLCDVVIRPTSRSWFPENYVIEANGKAVGQMHRRRWGEPMIAIATGEFPPSVRAMLACCCLISVFKKVT